MAWYPLAEKVQWKYESPQGPTYFKGTNRPSAVVLHRMQGYYRTARAWAVDGHYGASWHYSISLAGDVMQHLDHQDGGYHAGVADTQTAIYPPTWPLWKGPGINVNNYTIGLEMEGFAGQPHPPEQLAALKALCEWLSDDLGGIPYERERYPYHGEIDVVNRVNDFNTPSIREEVYQYLFEEDALTDRDILAIFGSTEATEEERLANAKYRYEQSILTGNSPFNAAANALAHADSPHTGAPIPDLDGYSRKGHTHVTEGDV